MRPGQAALRQGYVQNVVSKTLCPKHCVQNIVSKHCVQHIFYCVQLFTSISYFYFLVFFDNFGHQIFIGASEKKMFRYQNCCHLGVISCFTPLFPLMPDTPKSNSTSRVHAHGLDLLTDTLSVQKFCVQAEFFV